MYNFEEPCLEELLPNLCYSIKCHDDNYPISPIMKPKGQAGVMTIWKTEINRLVTTCNDGSTRCLLVKLRNAASPVHLLNTYMPMAENNLAYEATLDEITEILHKNPHGKFV